MGEIKQKQKGSSSPKKRRNNRGSVVSYSLLSKSRGIRSLHHNMQSNFDLQKVKAAVLQRYKAYHRPLKTLAFRGTRVRLINLPKYEKNFVVSILETIRLLIKTFRNFTIWAPALHFVRPGQLPSGQLILLALFANMLICLKGCRKH
ncbi:MAG: hypothetical protein C3F02_02995 [Parcubacteria group bacterium]|nr:MAG: hypothetical protein C3F02_02995 [Parcubacteria group bacterium]